MRPTALLAVAALAIVGCRSSVGLGTAVEPPQIAAVRPTFKMNVDPAALRALLEQGAPIAPLALPVPSGPTLPVSFREVPAQECPPLPGQRVFKDVIAVAGDTWHVRAIAGGGRIRLFAVSRTASWSYSVADLTTGTLIAQQLNPPGECAVTRDDAGLLEAVFASRNPLSSREWPVKPRTLRFAVSATYEFQRDFKETARVANENVQMVSAILERFTNVSLCTVLDPRAIEQTHGTIYTKNSDDERRQRAHDLFNELDLTYDVGQVFHVGGKSRVKVGGMCTTAFRGNGITKWILQQGRDNEENVWTLAHEIAHQLGASHTFNGDYGGREDRTAVEPDQGISLLAYPDARSRHWFHPVTISQILNHVDATAAQTRCGLEGHSPTASAPRVQDVSTTVPANTPFTVRVPATAVTYAIGEMIPGAQPGASPPWTQPREPSSDPAFTFPDGNEKLPPPGSTLVFLALAQDAHGSIGFGRYTVTIAKAGFTFDLFRRPGVR